MFNFFKRRKPAPAPVIIDDIPAHAGFEIAQVDARTGRVLSRFHRATLKDAQVFAARGKIECRKVARAFNRSTPAVRYVVRNLETGRFCPVNWTVTRAEVVA